jgi:SAM-dependent methyltransferase
MSYQLRFQSELFQIKEFFKNVYLYWRYPRFALSHIKLIACYLGKNPFHISRKYLENKGEEEVYAYGETPLTTLEEICNQCAIDEGDRVYELGCGRGLTCLWLRHVRGCRVTGVEFVPTFISKAKSFEGDSLTFLLEDFTKLTFEKADVVYLYGSCLDDASLQKLTQQLQTLKIFWLIVCRIGTELKRCSCSITYN